MVYYTICVYVCWRISEIHCTIYEHMYVCVCAMENMRPLHWGCSIVFYFFRFTIANVFSHPHFSSEWCYVFHWLSCSLVIFIEIKSINFWFNGAHFISKRKVERYRIFTSISTLLTEFILQNRAGARGFFFYFRIVQCKIWISLLI